MPCEKCKCAECAKGRRAVTSVALESVKMNIEGLEKFGRLRFLRIDSSLSLAHSKIAALSLRCEKLEKAAERKRWWQR